MLVKLRFVTVVPIDTKVLECEIFLRILSRWHISNTLVVQYAKAEGVKTNTYKHLPIVNTLLP